MAATTSSADSQTINAEYLNPFIEATVSVFNTMLGCEVSRTGLALHDSFTPEFDITGIIGLSGKASGDIVISFEKCLALSAAEALAGEHYDEISQDVIDTVGELTNMIAGNAKASMEKFEMHLALPTVIVGKNHSICFPSKVRPISIPFKSSMGKLNVEIGLAPSD